MVDLLLIHPNDQKAVYGDTLKYVACEPPFWMAIATQYCLERGVDVEVLDAEAENLSFDEVSSFALKVSPHLIGIFVTGTHLSASTQKMHGADVTCDYIKEKCGADIPIFYWGLHPSALPERTILESKADYVIKGESFNSIIALVDYHKSGKHDKQKMGGGILQRHKWGYKKLWTR